MTVPMIHINGWPGCGKRTIARALGRRIGARVVDTHLILDPAVANFGRGTAGQARLRETIRAVVYEAALSLPPVMPLVLTDALSDDDGKLIEPSLASARRRGAPLLSILLDRSHEESTRGLTAANRQSSGKFVDAAVLSGIGADEKLPTLPDTMHLDVDALTAEDAAIWIEAHLPDPVEDQGLGTPRG